MNKQERDNNNPYYWPGIDNQKELTEEQQSEALQKQKEFDLMTARIFNTKDGIKWLDNLKTFTIEQPCWFPDLGSEGAFHGYMREGQNRIVRDILTSLTRAKENYKNE